MIGSERRVGLSVLAGMALAACGGAPEAAPPAALPAGVVELPATARQGLTFVLDTVALEAVAVPLAVPASITTADPRTATIGSIVEGRVDEVLVLPGAAVRAGQLLARIHSHELATARRDLAAAEAQAAFAASALRRAEALLAADAVSQEEVERRRTTLAAAAAERERAAELVSHLHPVGDDVGVLAPRGGTVLAVHVKRGAAVTVGAPLLDVGDTRALWAEGAVPERALRQLAAGRAARVVLAEGDTLEGRIASMGGALDTLRRTLDVRVALASAPAWLRPGVFATLLLPGGERAPRAVLPGEAVQRLADGERFRAVPVTGAMLPDGRVAVTGLVAGQVVVVKGAYALRARLEQASAPAGE
jgi:cobalt-zinc-cadmium efflux system membrane fusion protein